VGLGLLAAVVILEGLSAPDAVVPEAAIRPRARASVVIIEAAQGDLVGSPLTACRFTLNTATKSIEFGLAFRFRPGPGEGILGRPGRIQEGLLKGQMELSLHGEVVKGSRSGQGRN